ncbi:MAG: ferredoxin--nitrite reductase [Terrimicrobiaceae bacterium]
MIDIHPNYRAVLDGLIEPTPEEKLKLEKDGLDVIHDIYRYAKAGFSAITEDDFTRMKWYGVYRQKPKDSGYFMMRTKVPGGQLSGEQAIALSEIADEFGHGLADITTRQTIQYHWLRIEDIPAIFERLSQVGLITSGACGDITRNVACCPVSGINPDEIIDASGHMQEISAKLTNTKEFSNLPRKYKIAISGCHIHCHQPDINCLGFFGLRNGRGEAGYGIKVGGGLSSAPHMAQLLPVWIDPDQTWAVAKAVTEIYRDEGYRNKRNRARFKFLIADWGVDKTLAEVEERLGYQLARHQDFVFPKDQESDHMGIHAQSQPGLYWVGVTFPGGRLRNGQLASIGRLAKAYCLPGHDAVRLTNKQNLIIPHVPEANLPALKAEMDRLGLVHTPSNFRKGCVSCTGIEFCNLAVAETKNRMIELVDQLEKKSSWFDGKVRIHFSGCPSSCGQHQIADIGFRGARTKVDGKMVDAYDLFVGGRLGENRRFNDLVKGKILRDDVDIVIDAILRGYEAGKQNGESLSEYLERSTKEELIATLPEKYR